jgi:hypothetical protein
MLPVKQKKGITKIDKKKMIGWKIVTELLTTSKPNFNISSMNNNT